MSDSLFARPASQAGSSTVHDLRTLADAMQSLSDRAAHDGHAPLEGLVAIAVEQVRGTRSASVSLLRHSDFRTEAWTDDWAVAADLLQYDIGSGPCVDAVVEDSLYVTGDVGSDPRWPTWGRRAERELGVQSVLSQRLHVHEQADVVAGLNLYSDQPDAFDDHAVGMALVLATHAARVLGETLAEARADNLMRALASNREIGVAMGILMHQQQFTREEAFNVLRVASQDSNRKLADIAAEVAETGALSIPRRTAR